CTCQPKLPPGAILIESRIIDPVCAWIVVACIFPTASAVATMGGLPPSEGDAVVSMQTNASPSSLIFIPSSSFERFVHRAGRLGGGGARELCGGLSPSQIVTSFPRRPVRERPSP